MMNQTAAKALARAGVKVWNTGRQYSAEGQRMAAVVLPDGRVLFADYDRYIDGITTQAIDFDIDDVKSHVMDAYDYGRYNGATLADVCDAFECAPGDSFEYENALRQIAKEQKTPYLEPAERIECGADFSIASYFTDGQPARPFGQNKGRPTATGISVSGCGRVVSLPARLNNFRMVELEEVAALLRGESVAAACAAFNRGEKCEHEEAAARVLQTLAAMPGAPVGASMTVRNTPSGLFFFMWCGARSHRLAVSATSQYRLMAHWLGFLEQCGIAQRDELPAPPAVVYLDVEHVEVAPAPQEEEERAIDAEEERAAAAQNLAAPVVTLIDAQRRYIDRVNSAHAGHRRRVERSAWKQLRAWCERRGMDYATVCKDADDMAKLERASDE